ncbi:MAG: nucleotidyltransferase domain-containing protein [Bacteroidia bacterium]
MLNRKTAIETATGFINDLRLLGYNPTQAWLFGSVVSDTAHLNSDIDLALWDEKFTGVHYLDGDKIKKLLLKYKLIEFHPYPSTISEKEDPFIGEIMKTGERIL